MIRLVLPLLVLTSSLRGYAQEYHHDQALDLVKALKVEETYLDKRDSSLPRNWLFLDERNEGIVPLEIDRQAFNRYSWFKAMAPDAVRLFYQFNSRLRDVREDGEFVRQILPQLVKVTRADAVLLRKPDGQLKIYSKSATGIIAEQFEQSKLPTFDRSNPAAWLINSLGYDAVVLGNEDGYLILAKLRQIPVEAQGLIIRDSKNLFESSDETEPGALIEVIAESKDLLVAKILLAKNSKAQIPKGSRVIFGR